MCIRDGRDFLAKETKLEALNYFNDGLITLQAFPAAESRSMEKLLGKRSICPTLAEGETGKLPLNEKEKEEILFVSPPQATYAQRLTLSGYRTTLHLDRKTSSQVPGRPIYCNGGEWTPSLPVPRLPYQDIPR